MASDEPLRMRRRVVRVIHGDAVQEFVFVAPRFPTTVWQERTEEVRAMMERSISREVHARAPRAEASARAAHGVRAERVVANAVRPDKPGPVCVDTAVREMYRARRVEASPRGKRVA
jgi:hypothetical protein